MGKDSWEIQWSDRAERDLERAFGFMEERSLQSAVRWARVLVRSVGRLHLRYPLTPNHPRQAYRSTPQDPPNE